MSDSNIKGIHHITAIAGDPQLNLNFYSGVLGLRFIKKTVNFDAPDTYHLYYGDAIGTPGTALTFFPWGNSAWRGRAGTGQVTVISFAIPEESLDFWAERLMVEDISVHGPAERFGENVISFRDPDGIQIELITRQSESTQPWEGGPVPAEMGIRGFAGATLAVGNHEKTSRLLTETLDWEFQEESGNRYRYINRNSDIGNTIDLLELPNAESGRMGVGAVHHIAWRIAGDDPQLKKRNQLQDLGYQVTPVVDRNYFHSIYFREPEKILFEIATDQPGFLIDESPETLGATLRLPEWYESRRDEIEAHLPELRVPRPSMVRSES